VQTLLTVQTQNIHPRSVRQQSRAIIGLSNVIQAQSDRRGDRPHIRSKLREASFGVAHAIKRLLELDRSIARTFECPNVKPAGII
jgi:hypothetical protein